MSWVIVGGLVLAGVSANQQRNAGKADKIELELQAEQESLAAKGREAARRQELNKILSMNIVSVSAEGSEGTPQSIALSSAKQASLSEGIEGLSDRLRHSQLIRQAKGAKRAGDTQAAGTLLKAGIGAL